MIIFNIIFKTIGVLFISFIVFSIPFNGRPLFYTCSQYGSQMASDSQDYAKKTLKRGWNATVNYGQKLFSSSAPPTTVIDDAVKAQQSATKRKYSDSLEEITDEDKGHISDVIYQSEVNKQ